MKEDLKVAMDQVAYKYSGNGGRNARVGNILQDLLNKTNRTQQLREQESARREKETKDTNAKIESLMEIIEQQHMFDTNQQKIKEECMQEMSKNAKTKNGRLGDAGMGAQHIVPSEGKKYPPGLFDGGDQWVLGVKGKTNE